MVPASAGTWNATPYDLPVNQNETTDAFRGTFANSLAQEHRIIRDG